MIKLIASTRHNERQVRFTEARENVPTAISKFISEDDHDMVVDGRDMKMMVR